MTHPVLELQAADTMADQLRHRRDHLAERDAVQAAKNALLRWNQRRLLLGKRNDELSSEIVRLSDTSGEIDNTLDRLNKQLKTIISPREAEALQTEIANTTARRGELDDEQLAAMEEQQRIETELADVHAQEDPLKNTYLTAEADLKAVENDIDSELVRIGERLESLRSDVDTKTLKKYDRLRKDHLIAAASLAGSRCDGCHLDLAPAEVDDIRTEAAKTGVANCPQCARLIVA